MPAGPRLVSIDQAASMAGCHVETLRRAIRNRELLATRHPTAKGRPYRINVQDLEAFLAKRRLG